MKKLYKVCLLIMLSASNIAHAITINFLDGSWQHYFENAFFSPANDNLHINHVVVSDFPQYSAISFVSVATESGAISFDWEIWSRDSFSQPTSVVYSAQFLGISLFSGILNSSDVYKGHAKTTIFTGDALSFSGLVVASPFAQNYNFDVGIRLFNVKSIPEPSTAALIGLGLAGFLGFKRKKSDRR